MRPFAFFHRRYWPRANFVGCCSDLRLRCELCNVKKMAREEMLHGGALLCDISSWRDRVIDCDYLSECDICSTSDVVLNFLSVCGCTSECHLCAIAPCLEAFLGALCPFFLGLPLFHQMSF
jgi:hypothetical protein